MHDGWIYEEVVKLGLTQSYYIYSDLRSAIKGHFRSNILASGVETKIIGYRLAALVRLTDGATTKW
jgi:hypothetical protein